MSGQMWLLSAKVLSRVLIVRLFLNLFLKGKKMVKAPEKFLDEYLRHQKGLASNIVTKTAREPMHSVSEEEMARLKLNLQMLWAIYNTPEIKEILSRKHRIHFLDMRGAKVSLTLSYVDHGVLMEYELDMGSKKELAGAQLYKQAEMNLQRYFTHKEGTEELLKTENPALQTVVDVFIGRELLESEVWNAIAKGEQIQLSTMSYLV